ncbi:MAG TPA: biopolymer transporter ExbD [Bryobacteraceae bacterium]|nr:biopolymer transporter ExbD [Bryobacteraceae bacterium]
MAIGVGGFGGGRRGRGTPALAEINVTPFVDVALVLLIIFMITAHVMEYGIEISVPKTKTVETTTKELPIVQLSKTGDLYLGKEIVNIHKLVAEVRTRYPGQETVFVRADGQTKYEILAQVLAELGAAKINPSLVTQPDSGGSSR